MKTKFSCDKDKEVFFKILKYNVKLLCGNNTTKIDEVGNKICKAINSVNIVSNGPDPYLDNKRLNGETISNGIGISDIYMKGFRLAPEFKHNQIKHTFSHELWHSIYAIMNRSNDQIDSNGNRRLWTGKVKEKTYFASGGAIVDRDTGEKYGKLFEETMMDIKASMSLAEFDSEFQNSNPNINADIILSEHIDNWSNNDKNGYATLSSITRLMIAAFSNEPDINYHYWIQKGESFDDIKTKRLDGSIMYANDFLYGMMYDPIYIMEEYDKYMGEGAYLDFLKVTDTIYEQAIMVDGKIDTRLIKHIMGEIPRFVKLRTMDLMKKGKFSDLEIKKLSSKFNKIWNSMQKEYGAYFSEDEIKRF